VESVLIWLIMNIHNILLVALIICVVLLIKSIYDLLKLLWDEVQSDIKTLERKIDYLYKNK